VHAYRDAFFARDVDALMALVTPDFVFENVTGGERIEGIEAARSHVAKGGSTPGTTTPSPSGPPGPPIPTPAGSSSGTGST
jgi:SnoaL-like domain